MRATPQYRAITRALPPFAPPLRGVDGLSLFSGQALVSPIVHQYFAWVMREPYVDQSGMGGSDPSLKFHVLRAFPVLGLKCFHAFPVFLFGLSFVGVCLHGLRRAILPPPLRP